MAIELSGDFGKRVQKRLTDEEIVWLTTVWKDRTPEPSPVWFYWDGSKIFIRSQPTVKVRNIEASPRVTLNFNSDGGANVVIINGTARVVTDEDFARVRGNYVAKYAEGIKELGTSDREMTNLYSVTLEIEPTKLRGH